MDDKLASKLLHNIITDLGWRPLLGTARIHVVMLYQRMRHEPADQPHTQWAQQAPPPRYTLIAYVRSMQQRLGIPDICIPVGKGEPLQENSEEAGVY